MFDSGLPPNVASVFGFPTTLQDIEYPISVLNNAFAIVRQCFRLGSTSFMLQIRTHLRLKLWSWTLSIAWILAKHDKGSSGEPRPWPPENERLGQLPGDFPGDGFLDEEC